MLQVESLTSWLLGKETEQEALPVHDDPVLHSSEVNSRLGEVSCLCRCFLAERSPQHCKCRP